MSLLSQRAYRIADQFRVSKRTAYRWEKEDPELSNTLKLLHPNLIKPVEAAKLLNVSKSTIYRWVDVGILEGLRVHKTIRIKHESIKAIIKPVD